MMSLGSFGGGGPSSSPPTSNLSALAPPFTVDRSNSKPSASPLLQFSESPYATGFSHTWQYANPAASGLDAYQKSELEADSTNITPMSSANDYHFRYSVSESNNTPSNCWSTLNSTAKTSTDPFLYDSEVGTYYPPYVSPVADEGTPLVALSDPSYDVLPSSGLVSANASSQVDYTQSLSGLEYTPSWGGICYGLVDTKRGKHAELDGSFIKDKSNASVSVAFTNYLNPACRL
ncbi:hypothetical protein M9H77_26287 [Catharanthus roseus]|uniref:Uncharacterized protein n=1 Tax=Catharanthus roseus TaxID=4058 RepID=A0ACC0ABE8_CATRO|nr:hypothetical protein M9H77_26287 [Catharanthus roseus]